MLLLLLLLMLLLLLLLFYCITATLYSDKHVPAHASGPLLGAMRYPTFLVTNRSMHATHPLYPNLPTHVTLPPIFRICLVMHVYANDKLRTTLSL